MKKIFQVILDVSILVCISSQNCSSEFRCTCVPLGNNSFAAICTGLGLTSSSFPRIYSNVKTVDLNHNSIKQLPVPLSEYLPETVVNFEITNNKIQYLRKSCFSKLKMLTYINLKENNLRYIEQGTFASLPLLQNLDLSWNRHLTFRVLRNLSHDAQFTQIQIIRLDGIHCSSGITTIILINDVESLANTSLQEIYMTRNRLGYIERGVLSALPKTISKIDVSSNALAVGPYCLELLRLTGLTFLNLGERSALGGENILVDCNDWRCPQVNPDNIMWNTKYSFPKYKIAIPPNLKVMMYENAHAVIDIGALTISNNSLEIINARGNTFHNWIGPIKNLHKLKYLDLSNVDGKNISEYFFSDCPVLETLKINHNTLGSVLALDRKGVIFKHLNALKHLEIANNFIFSLPLNFFKNLSSLEILDLSSNYLTDWVISIAHMKNLRSLDLSFNRLNSFSSTTMNEIDEHITRVHLNISLKDNALQCTCGTLNFLRWMFKKSHIFIDFNSYHCQNAGKFIHFTELEIEIHNLEEKCSEYTGMIIGLCVVVVICFFIIACGIVYRYRWRLRYMYYTGRGGYEINVTGHRFDFDAFISYADEDREAVLQIAETLENQHDFRLQLHQRDFLAGKSIAENITDTIHNCHKTVIMLSANFLGSKWCIFEFHMARMESIFAREGGDVIIIVLLQPIRSRDIPIMMMDIMQSDSYVEYSENKEDQVFLEKLQRAINRC